MQIATVVAGVVFFVFGLGNMREPVVANPAHTTTIAGRLSRLLHAVDSVARLQPATAALLFARGPRNMGDAIPPIIALPVGAELVAEPNVAACFAQLLKLGGYGKRPQERAAFLVLHAHHRFACIVWPPSFGYRSERWIGPIPDGTVAIVHTHPEREPHPSSFDIEEAERIGVPILVLTNDSVTVAYPSRKRVATLAGKAWAQRGEGAHCSCSFAH